MMQQTLDEPSGRARPCVLSYGGGVDSFAVLLDSIVRGEQPDVVAFVDVADGSPTRDPNDPGEWPGTYKHIREVVMPLCARLGIRFEWIDSTRYPIRDARSLFAWLWARGQIPVAGPKRLCTTIAKVERIRRDLSRSPNATSSGEKSSSLMRAIVRYTSRSNATVQRSAHAEIAHDTSNVSKNICCMFRTCGVRSPCLERRTAGDTARAGCGHVRGYPRLPARKTLMREFSRACGWEI